MGGKRRGERGEMCTQQMGATDEDTGGMFIGQELKQHFTGARSELNITSIDFRDYNDESEVLQNASIIINFGCRFNSYSSEQPWPLSRPCGHPNCKLMLLNYSTVTVPHKGATRASGGAVPTEARSFPPPAAGD